MKRLIVGQRAIVVKRSLAMFLTSVLFFQLTACGDAGNASVSAADTATEPIASVVSSVDEVDNGTLVDVNSEMDNSTVSSSPESNDSKTLIFEDNNASKWCLIREQCNGELYEYLADGSGRLSRESHADWYAYSYEYNDDGSYRRYEKEKIFISLQELEWRQLGYTDFTKDGLEIYFYGAECGYDLLHDKLIERNYSYDYNEDGLPIRQYCSYGEGGFWVGPNYEYDDMGRLIASYHADDYGQMYLYNDSNFYEYIRIDDKDYLSYTGKFSNSCGMEYSYEIYYNYDENGVITDTYNVDYSVEEGVDESYSVTYFYDTYGNLIKKEDSRGNVTSYSYSFDVFPETSDGELLLRTVTEIYTDKNGNESTNVTFCEYNFAGL